jgi:mannitol-specific phosphotransferase system IIBC component
MMNKRILVKVIPKFGRTLAWGIVAIYFLGAAWLGNKFFLQGGTSQEDAIIAVITLVGLLAISHKTVDGIASLSRRAVKWVIAS